MSDAIGIAAKRGRDRQRSKTGCAQCKRRKIKCDETRPTCHKCSANGEQCDYHPAARYRDNQASVRDDASQLRRELAAKDATHATCLKLLHHFCTVTYATLSDSPTVQGLIQGAFVELALDSPFLLYRVFSVASLHKSYEAATSAQAEQETQFKTLALYYHDKALHTILNPATGTASETTGLEPAMRANPSAVFAFAALTSIYAFASIDSETQTDGSNPSVLTDWISLTRGVRNIIAAQGSLDSIRSGPLAALFDGHGDPETWSLPERIDKALDNIKLSWANADEDSVQHYIEAFDLLRLIYYKATAASQHRMPGALASEIGILFSWPALISSTFFSLLTALDPPALVILAHVLVLYQSLAPRFWWVGARPAFMVGIVQSSLPKEPFWSAQVRWAADQIQSRD